MSSAIFTGSSSFAGDLKSVITRAVSIASMPVEQLTSAKTEMEDEATALGDLQTGFESLQQSIAAISDALGQGSYSAGVSDTGVVSAAIGDGAMEGNYSVQVLDAGAYATSLTAGAWNQSSGSHTYQVAIGEDKIDINPADNTAAAIAAAINFSAGSRVRATVVNVGSNSAPDYRISLQNLSLGDSPVDILDNGAGLQSQKTTGRKAEYIVNNSGITVQGDSRTLNIASGLTVTLLPGGSGKSADITVTRSTSELATALSAFADAYNTVAESLDSQRGDAGGALAGNSLVYDLQDALSSISAFSDSSLARGLEDLGIKVDGAGQMTFDMYKLMATDLINASGVVSFLGSVEGGGFLKSASQSLDYVLNSTGGVLTNAENSLASEITDIASQITGKQAAVNELEIRLTEQMAAADAAIAAMEQSYGYLSNLFAAMKTNAESYN